MFSRPERLGRVDFTTYFKLGKRYQSPHFTIVHTPAERRQAAVVVGKKTVKGAVGRNRLRRQLNHRLKDLTAAHRGIFIVIVKKGVQVPISNAVESEFTDLVGRIVKAR